MISFVFVSWSCQALRSLSCFFVRASSSSSQSSSTKISLSWSFDLSQWASLSSWIDFSYSRSEGTNCYDLIVLSNSLLLSSSLLAVSRSLYLAFNSCSVLARMSFWLFTPSLSFLTYSSAAVNPSLNNLINFNHSGISKYDSRMNTRD